MGARIFAGHQPLTLTIPLLVAMTTPLVMRRRYPALVFVIVAGAAFLQWMANIPVGPWDLAVLVALYTVAADGRDRVTTLAAAAVVLGGAGLAVVRWYGGEPVAGVIVPIAVTAVALALGDDRRTRRAYFAGLEERAERLERESDALAAVAAAAERARIARELHDVVAHSLSVMIAQADGAAYTVGHDPKRAGQAMETVAETGRDALTEMHRLLGVLRSTSSETDLVPQPGVGAIPDLVDKVRGAGLPIGLVIDGAPPELPAGMELAIYRVVQEALTNTLKHTGPGATAQVDLSYGDRTVTVRVTDDGAGVHQPGEATAGQGLAGMRERIAMYGGTLDAAPGPDGGFVVVAGFPLHAAVA
jgi:signal transduction histidine kinase